MYELFGFRFAACLAIVFALTQCQRSLPTGTTQAKESNVVNPTKALHATLSLPKPKVRSASELEVRVTIANPSSSPVRLNALWCPFASLMLRVRMADNSPVRPGPPPTPVVDDGTTGRIDIPPRGTVEFAYSGREYFAQEITPGRYEMRFSYENTVSSHGDWTGVLESNWVPFEIVQ
jgi:hypothetical protein